MAFPLSSAFFLIPIYKYPARKTRKSMFFSHFWVSRLLFPLPYPLPRHCLGIVTAFSSSIPTTSPLSGYDACFFSLIPTTSPLAGYHAYFSSLIPTTSPLSGYHACFSPLIPTTSPLSGYRNCFLLFHTHYGCLIKNHARNKESPSKKLGLMFQLF